MNYAIFNTFYFSYQSCCVLNAFQTDVILLSKRSRSRFINRNLAKRQESFRTVVAKSWRLETDTRTLARKLFTTAAKRKHSLSLVPVHNLERAKWEHLQGNRIGKAVRMIHVLSSLRRCNGSNRGQSSC